MTSAHGLRPRVLQIFTIITLVISMMSASGWAGFAQDDDGTPVVENANQPSPTPEATEPAEETQTVAATEPAIETPVPEPTELPPVVVPETLTTPATEPVVTTPTPLPTTQPPAPAADAPAPATIHYIAVSGSSSGDRIAGACFTITNPSYGFPEGYGCTDANGEATVQTSTSFSGVKGFNIAITSLTGYQPIDSLLRFFSAGQTNTVEVIYTPLAPVTETLRAIDSTTGNAVGGVCWSYDENLNYGTPGNLAIGPVCDDDNDGAVTVPDIPWRAYCVIVTPPTGYLVVGTNTICTEADQRGTDITKALSTTASTGSGTLTFTVTAPWGAPVADVCGQVSLVVAGNPFTVASACSDTAGRATIANLGDGSYTLSALTWPGIWQRFTPAPFTIAGGNTATLALTLTPVSGGAATLKTVLVAGPATVGGSCWSITTAIEPGAPGYYEVAAPVCDSDGDGIVVLDSVPYGLYCFQMTPPPGYQRTDRRYGFCLEQPASTGFTLTVGVSQIPPTPTATTTVSPTPSPTPTTPVPTPTPVPNEPNGNITAINCADDHKTFSDGSPYFDLCQSPGAGVQFAVLQHGVQIATITTGADGTAALSLPDRSPYVLQYLGGNTALYVPAPGQSTMLRYDSQQRFVFVRDPASDHTWTFVARIIGYNDGLTVATGLGGSCAQVVGADNVVALPEVCDTDNDGVIVIGQLAPRYGVSELPFYHVEMTQPPTGYFLKSFQGGVYDPNQPNTFQVLTTYVTNTLRIHIVDEQGNPVLGFSIRGDDSIYGGSTRYDGPDPYESGEPDPLDGIVEFEGLVPGVNHTFTVLGNNPGWINDGATYTWATGTNPYTDVTITVHPLGTVVGNQAQVHIQLKNKDLGPDYTYPDNRSFQGICARISGFIGIPAGGACGSASGEILIRNVPQGSYSLILNYLAINCGRVPASVPFRVGAADLGGTVEVTVEVTGCGFRKTSSCTVFRETPGDRSIDIYYGTLTDPNGASRLDTVQLSETIPAVLRESLLGGANPDPTHITSASLAPWAEPYVYGSGGPDWSKRPDWDGNAYQSMVGAYNGVSGDYVLGNRIDRGTTQLVSGSGIDFVFIDGPDTLAEYPECAADTAEVLVLYQYTTTVHLYELNATETAPVTPAPTPIPSPEPLCQTTVSRELTAYYGVVTQNSAVISNNLALSEHIPAALRDAIANGAPPDPVGQQISTWVGSGIAADTWYQAPDEGLDAEANLRSQLSNGGATVGTPSDRGTTTYTYTNYRYLDITDLPPGCSPQLPDDEVRPAFSILIPVTQQTTVTVHYIELNATLASTGTPTATATPSSTATPAVSPTPGTTPYPTPTANPATIRGLPNTGNGATAPDNEPLLLLIATLILAFLLTGTLLLRRHA